MKRKAYLRGLGIGIAVTALFMTVYHNNHSDAMTDDQVRARARELGMIENTVLSSQEQNSQEQNNQEQSSQDQETELDESTDVADQETELDEPSAEPSDEVAEPEDGSIEADSLQQDEADEVQPEDAGESGEEQDEPNESQDEASEPQPQPQEPAESTGTDGTTGTTETVEITVNRGDASYTVCVRLQDAGVIEDARDFDRYLSQNGYDKRIITGTHQVPVGGTYEEIAQIIAAR